jgi:hypothetical protein
MAAPVTGDRLIRQIEIVTVVQGQRFKDNVNSPTYVRVKFDRETIITEPILRPVIHDGHGFCPSLDPIPIVLDRIPNNHPHWIHAAVKIRIFADD